MFYKYESVDQLKQLRDDIKKTVGIGEMPTLNLSGTVKIHGSNGGVTVTRDEGLYVQSRNRTLSGTSDNAGFFRFVDGNTYFDKTRQSLCNNYNEMDVFTIYGEWCGGNIQKGVGVSGMEPVFVIFDVVGREDPNSFGTHIPLSVIQSSPANRVYKVTDFGTFNYELDLSSQESIDKLDEITLAVEAECPVAKQLNPSGNLIGEGVVWTTQWGGKYWKFKSKGTKHARGGGSKKISVGSGYTPEQVGAVKSFCEAALTNDRLLQGVEYLAEMGLDTSPKNTGKYLKWVMQDICKELKLEIEELEASQGITWKHISKQITLATKDFYVNL